MHLIVAVAAAVIMFAVMVAVHEGGHFAAARAVGVKVNEFSIGMGPLIINKEKNGTVYSLRALPIGGYCALEGENEESGDEHAFHNRPAWAKAVVLAAGPFMNFLLALLILAALITYMGTSVTSVIAAVEPGSPAAAAGIQEGYIITEVDGRATPDGPDVRQAIQDAAGRGDRTTLKGTDREGVPFTKVLTFTVDENNNKVIGVRFRSVHNPFRGMQYAFLTSVTMEKEMLKILGELVFGQGSAEDVVGPVGIVTVVDQTAQTGLLNLFYLMALLSLNLALVNILPFPALDGGRLVFVIIRAVTGKVITDEIENRVHYAGLMVLFFLMILITMKDVNTFILN